MEDRKTNQQLHIKRFFKDIIYLFCRQEHLKHVLENCRFCRKSRNDAYSRGGVGGRVHVICVIMKYCLRTSTCIKKLPCYEFLFNFCKSKTFNGFLPFSPYLTLSYQVLCKSYRIQEAATGRVL